jgi:hypothetical protein
MALITRDEVKYLLNLTDTTYDTRIDTLIPYVQDDVCQYLNTFFQDGYVHRESGSALVITRATTTTGTAAPDTITDNDSLFLQKGFLSNMDVAVEGGYSNVGVHHVVTAAAGTLTLSSTGAVITQNPNSTSDNNYIGSIIVSRVNWPRALKRYAAQMIWHNIQKNKPSGAQSESIDDYSITYAPLENGGYPEEVLSGLRKWRKVAMR